MTTIVYRDGVMAGDSQVTANYSVTGHQRKVHRINGHLIGCCGKASEIQSFLNWWGEGRRKEDKPSIQEDFSALTVNKKGDISQWDKTLVPYPKKEVYCAIGAGSDIAFGAFFQGANAVEAVDAAILHDVLTGGDVHFVELGEDSNG